MDFYETWKKINTELNPAADGKQGRGQGEGGGGDEVERRRGEGERAASDTAAQPQAGKKRQASVAMETAHQWAEEEENGSEGEEDVVKELSFSDCESSADSNSD